MACRMHIPDVFQDSSHSASHDVCHVGNIIRYEESIDDLLADKNDGNQNEGQRNLPITESGKGRHNNKSKYHAAGTAKSHIREQDVIHKTGGKSGHSDDNP